VRTLALVLLLVTVARPAAAEDDHLFAGDGLFRPPIEWSAWVRGSYGAQTFRQQLAARTLSALSVETRGIWDFGVGAEASLALSRRGNVRLGAWTELRGWAASDTFLGGELVFTRVPNRMDMFLYEGHGILSLRAGRSFTHATGALAYGYLAPYWLEGPCRMRFYEIHTGVCTPRPERTARYMAGVRVVATVTRALDDPREWSATIGVEFEPIGALRMMLIARSWY
jgi:hypothetical protein